MSYAPLDGVRVLDLSRYLPGGVLTRKLADLGADVVKVESPNGGDPLRRTPPYIAGESIFHRLVNHGKRSIAIDYGTPPGAQQVRALAEVADVIVEVSTGTPGALARVVDLSELRSRRPEVVVCTVSGFGVTGPLAGMASHGLTLAALSGMLPLADGSVERGAPRIASVTHVSAVAIDLPASNAAFAVTAALLSARTGGSGAWIDLSCWDVTVEAQRSAVLRALANAQTGNELDTSLGPLYGLYVTLDERVVQFAAIERQYWNAFCAAIGQPELTSRFAAGKDYDYGDASLTPVLEAIFASRTALEWFELFVEHGLPAAPVQGMDDIVAGEHIQARGLLRNAGDVDSVTMLNPIRWMETDTRPGEHARRAPDVGAQTDEILDEWLS